MPRPASRAALLETAGTQFDSLMAVVASMSEAERASTFDFSGDPRKKEEHWARDEGLRDVLVHLYEWHQLLLVWVAANMDGESRPFLPAPYTWATYGQMNRELRDRHQEISLNEAEHLLLASHVEATELIGRFTDDELFEKRHFPWTGTTSLGSYCVSASSSHYDWAIKKLRAHLARIR